MGMARAVVSTTVGAEGLPVTDGRDIVLADSAPDFADSVLALMHDPARRVQLEQAARDLVVTRYDWSAVAGQLEDALVTAAAKRTIAAA
jgi:glycosyltransferase involved in cell wall biosynthesis